MAHPRCDWPGASGTAYLYSVWPLPADFGDGQVGNYIFAKLNAEGKWVPIYIGEGDLVEQVSKWHPQAACIEQKGATHVHVHLCSSKRDRAAEEDDLLARFTNAICPHGCNENPVDAVRGIGRRRWPQGPPARDKQEAGGKTG